MARSVASKDCLKKVAPKFNADTLSLIPTISIQLIIKKEIKIASIKIMT